MKSWVAASRPKAVSAGMRIFFMVEFLTNGVLRNGVCVAKWVRIEIITNWGAGGLRFSKMLSGGGPAMNIELSVELEQLVRSQLASGRYQTAVEVLIDALGLLEERDLYTIVHSDEIRKKVDQGYDSLRAGGGVDGDTVFERIEKELIAMDSRHA